MTEEGHGQAEAGRRNGVEIKQREVWSGGDAADLLFKTLASVCVNNVNVWLLEGRGRPEELGLGTPFGPLSCAEPLSQPLWTKMGGKALRGK